MGVGICLPRDWSLCAWPCTVAASQLPWNCLPRAGMAAYHPPCQRHRRCWGNCTWPWSSPCQCSGTHGERGGWPRLNTRLLDHHAPSKEARLLPWQRSPSGLRLGRRAGCQGIVDTREDCAGAEVLRPLGLLDCPIRLHLKNTNLKIKWFRIWRAQSQTIKPQDPLSTYPGWLC